jgi:hypothetical protein
LSLVKDSQACLSLDQADEPHSCQEIEACQSTLLQICNLCSIYQLLGYTAKQDFTFSKGRSSTLHVFHLLSHYAPVSDNLSDYKREPHHCKYVQATDLSYQQNSQSILVEGYNIIDNDRRGNNSYRKWELVRSLTFEKKDPQSSGARYHLVAT